MLSLKEYIFLEDEDKFVKIDYDTVTGTDDVNLANPVNIEYKDKLGDGVTPNDGEGEGNGESNPDDILPGGADVALVGEIRLYSETSDLFKERKRKIADKFKSLLKDDEISANRVKCTKVFDYYITHLLNSYVKDIDNNCKLNVSSRKELSRQLSDDLVLLIRNNEVIPN